MCGIYGGVALGDGPLRSTDFVDQMGILLRHRGPDAHGVRSAPRAVMGAERLRIFDPTPAGDQPFADGADRIWLAVNGAIYNAPELRRRYLDYPYRSRSDAESILPLYLDRGRAGISELDGMFALAIYDSRERELVLARDRAGEKPLFYTHIGDEVWFASEIQALLSLPNLGRGLDLQAVRDFVTLGYVTEPKTMFADVSRVESGTTLVFSVRGRQVDRYWDPFAITRPRRSIHDPASELEGLLSNAVKKQLAGNEPVGIFTSGGVDSALLVALATFHGGPESVSTFSIGFPEPGFDESSYAKRLAAQLGTPNLTIVADRKALTEALGIVVTDQAEPSADPAILPTFLLARAASEQVKVVLGGEGADELFGGYPTYVGHRATPFYRRLPLSIREAADRIIRGMPAALESKVSLEYLAKRFVAAVNLPLGERHMAWFGTGAGSSVLSPELLALEYEPPTFPDAGDPIASACAFDYRTYLRDNLLPKMDRATMLASIEARTPYLDQHVTAFALALDPKLKVRGVTTKWLLKKVARRWLPKKFVVRKKRGLSVPVAAWLNEGLLAEVDRLFELERIRRQGLLHPGNIHQLLTEHRNRRANHGRVLWALLMLEYWMERWVPERN